MREESNNRAYRKIINEKLPLMTIDSKFMEKYYGNIAQAKFGLKQTGEFEDAMIMNGLAGIDCTKIDFSQLSQEEFEMFPFDSTTKFSRDTEEKFHPKEILEKGKSFGMEIDKLPLTGKNIHVAIIDQNFDPSTIDINLAQYDNSNVFEESDVEHMHGKATTSLLASKSCGVAKDAKVHFFGIAGSKNGKINSIEKIIEYNKNCKNQEDKILVVSGSWSLKSDDFKKYSEALRESGAELVCANNFNQIFHEVMILNGNEKVPLDFSQTEIDDIIKQFPQYAEKIIEKSQSANNVKIPMNRTYHQVGNNESFKYQSSYSVSWGVPQVAGLYAVFKEKDKTLSFSEFCNMAQKTAIGKNKIINPQGIFQEIEKIETKSKNSSNKLTQEDESKLSFKQRIALILRKSALKNVPFIKNFTDNQLNVLTSSSDDVMRKYNEAKEAFDNYITRNGELQKNPSLPQMNIESKTTENKKEIEYEKI